MLVAEPEMKRGRNHDEPPRGIHPFYVFHNMHSHNTNDCQELCRHPERNDRGYGCKGGCGGGRWDNCDPRQD